jgi:hypothetical protein
MNHSSLEGLSPSESSILLRTRPEDASLWMLETSWWRKSIISDQIGAAPVTPLTFHMGSPV